MDKLIGGRIMTDRYVDTERERGKRTGKKRMGPFTCSIVQVQAATSRRRSC